MKIIEVSFNIANEASYVYILSGQKLTKNSKMVHFGEFLKTWSLRSNSVTRQVSFLIGQKLVENAKIKKFKCDIFSNFQTMCSSTFSSCFYCAAAFLTKAFNLKSPDDHHHHNTAAEKTPATFKIGWLSFLKKKFKIYNSATQEWFGIME